MTNFLKRIVTRLEDLIDVELKRAGYSNQQSQWIKVNRHDSIFSCAKYISGVYFMENYDDIEENLNYDPRIYVYMRSGLKIRMPKDEIRIITLMASVPTKFDPPSLYKQCKQVVKNTFSRYNIYKLPIPLSVREELMEAEPYENSTWMDWDKNIDNVANKMQKHIRTSFTTSRKKMGLTPLTDHQVKVFLAANYTDICLAARQMYFECIIIKQISLENTSWIPVFMHQFLISIPEKLTVITHNKVLV